MNKIKVRLYIKVLPQDDLIPCKKMHYAIVPLGKKHTDHLWDNKSLSIEEAKSKWEKNNKPFSIPPIKSGSEFDHIKKLEELRLKTNRSGLTNDEGYTQEMYLPKGSYDIWIKRDDSDWEIAHLPNRNRGFVFNGNQTLINYQVRQYYRYQIVNFNNKPLGYSVNFETYTFDKNGKEIKIEPSLFQGKKVSKKTDNNGFTPLLYSPDGQVIFVKFIFSNMKEQPKKSEIKHYATMSKNNYVVVRLKSVAAVTEVDKTTTVVMQGTGKPPVILNMQSEEMVILSEKDYEEFEKESAVLDKVFSNSHEAKEQLAQAIKSGKQTNIQDAEKKVADAQKAIQEELNKNFKKMTDLTEVITFEVRKKNNPNGNNQEFDFRRRYIKTDRYLQLEQRKKNKEQLKFKALGKTIRDWTALRQSQGVTQTLKTIKNEQWEQVKDEFKKVNKEFEILKWEKNGIWDFPGIGGALVEQVKLTDNLTVDTQSQWFRCVGGAGASSSLNWKPFKGEVGANLKVSLQAKVVLFEGKKKVTYTCPSDEGFMLSVMGYDLGAIRGVMSCELFGFMGAKVAADIGVSVAYSKEGRQQLIANGRRNTNPSLANNNTGGRPRFIPMDKDEKIIEGGGASAQGEIEAFAGVEAGLTLGGDFQWLSPEEKDFVSLAKLSGSLAGSAGAGGAANFYVYFYNGQFRIKAKAALCLGIGAKGMLDFTVAAEKVLDFLTWVRYSLMRAHFKVLRYIAPEAFEELKNLAVLALGTDSKVVDILSSTEQNLIDFNKRMDKAEASNSLSLKIKRKPQWLLKAPPESKGMLLYQMTRHGVETHLADFGLTYHLPNHKEAVIAIFETITLKSEWDTVLKRISIKGEETNISISSVENNIREFLRSGLWAKSTDKVLDSLEPSYNNAKRVYEIIKNGKDESKKTELNLETKYVEKFNSLKSKLIEDYPLHTAMVLNGTPEFELLCSEINTNPQCVNEDILFANTTYKFEPSIIDTKEADEFILAMSNSDYNSNMA